MKREKKKEFRFYSLFCRHEMLKRNASRENKKNSKSSWEFFFNFMNETTLDSWVSPLEEICVIVELNKRIKSEA